MTTFPFDDINKLEAEEAALPDIPHFPSIFATENKQARLNRQDQTFVCPHCFNVSKTR
tara:strand:+ start:5100 stop:5273 length:174 start_codon:yes stop_codon:yes gene_type:complete